LDIAQGIVEIIHRNAYALGEVSHFVRKAITKSPSNSGLRHKSTLAVPGKCQCFLAVLEIVKLTYPNLTKQKSTSHFGISKLTNLIKQATISWRHSRSTASFQISSSSESIRGLCRRLGSGVNFINILTRAFIMWNCFAQLFSSYSLALQFFGARITAQKLLVKCWWNWRQYAEHLGFEMKIFDEDPHQLIGYYSYNLVCWFTLPCRALRYNRFVTIVLL